MVGAWWRHNRDRVSYDWKAFNLWNSPVVVDYLNITCEWSNSKLKIPKNHKPLILLVWVRLSVFWSFQRVYECSIYINWARTEDGRPSMVLNPNFRSIGIKGINLCHWAKIGRWQMKSIDGIGAKALEMSRIEDKMH